MVLSEPFLSDITQINFNIVAMVCGRGLPIEVSNHQFSLPAVFVEIWPFRATSFRRFARPVPTMPDHLGADFHQLLPQRGQRPVLHFHRKGESPLMAKSGHSPTQ